MQRLQSYSFPEVVTFYFKNTSNGFTTKLLFDSSTKISDFIKNIDEKSKILFDIPQEKPIEIVEAGEKGENGDALDPNDETLLCDKYRNNYKYVSFYIRTV